MVLYGNDFLKESIFLQENYEIRGFKLKGPKNSPKDTKTISYRVPGSIKEATIEHFVDHVNKLPENDNPEVFGLNEDANLTF